MSWADKVGKPSGDDPKKKQKPDVDFKVIDEENDVPFQKVEYIRIGSAHAVERKEDREQLKSLLEKFVQAVNEEFSQTPAESNAIFCEEKY